ncbi:translation initiation factor IF-3 [candidate division KSB1 bacterium]|nr:translation initiation factor IF-3 [candidate division KSB1 bacterium]
MRVNDQIRSPKVRVIDSEGNQIGVLDVNEAQRIAEREELDLVEIASTTDPPVCKIMDFGKYKYELSKKEKLVKKKQHVIQVKEIRMRPSIEDHDFEFKIKNARKFIEQGNKVKVSVVFKGRELAHQEFGEQLIKRVEEELEDIARVENKPKLEGKSIVLFLVKK